MRNARILVVEDEDIAREYMADALRDKGYEVITAPTGKDALSALQTAPVDLVLSDIRMPGMDGMQLLEHVRSHYPDTEMIMATGYASIEDAVLAVKKGAFHYLPKPLRLDEMCITVERALEKGRMRAELLALKQASLSAQAQIIGSSPATSTLKEQIARVAGAGCTVLVLGETGTGKELVARALHEASDRKDNRFLAVNCASLSGDLLAHELFGHEKGAFTGATSMQKGLLESADGGTFFLDEVGDMPFGMQAGLLRVLENRTLFRVGGTKEVAVDVRIIAATNKDLAAMVETGQFRQDLYYRLNIMTIRIPALRERRADIPLLASHFIERACAERGKERMRLDDGAQDMLLAYDFPGNVRELRHAVERAVILCDGVRMCAAHFPPEIRRAAGSGFAGQEDDEVVSLEENERRYLAHVLEKAEGSTSKAARMLGLNRGSLWRKLKRLGLTE